MADVVPLGRRIWILGTPGSGKTTLATALRDGLALPYYELDQLFWQPGWRKTAKPEFLETVTRIAHSEKWIVDGQYESAHSVLRQTADTLVWLDSSFPIAFARVLRRSVRHLIRGTEVCNGNTESPLKMVDLLLWTVRSHTGTRRHNRDLFRELSAKGVHCVRVRSAAQRRALLVVDGR